MRIALAALPTPALALPAGAGAKRPPVTPAHEGGHANAPVVLATKAAGHDFGNHTYWHVSGASTTWTHEHLIKDIGDTTLLHEWITGDRHTYFRPPYDQWMPQDGPW